MAMGAGRVADAREGQLVREALGVLDGVVRRIARKLGRYADPEELGALGRAAIVDVIRAYQPDRGEFETFARLKLTWAIYDGLRKQTHGRSLAAKATALAAAERMGTELPSPLEDPPRAALADDYDGRLREFLDGQAAALAFGLVAAAGDLARVPDSGDSPEESTARRQESEALRRAVDALPYRERALVERHYFGEEPFDAIAEELGISKSWASRLHAQAVRSLSTRLRELRTRRDRSKKRP